MYQKITRVALTGPPLSHDRDRVEDLERADYGGHQHEHQHRPQQRDGDRPEHTQLGGAVDRTGLVHILRDGLQAGEDQQRGVADVPPDVDTGDRRHGLRDRADERLARDAEDPQELVDDPQLRVEHPQPEQRDHDVRYQPGQHQDTAHDDRLGQPIHQHRQADRQRRLERNIEHHIVERYPQRFPELRVAEHLLVVGEPDIFGRGEQIPVGEAEQHAAHRRIGVEHGEPDQAREDEDPGEQGLTREPAFDPRRPILGSRC